MSHETIRELCSAAKELDHAERIRAEVARLAKLDRAGYLAERKATAKSLAIPAIELDKLVEKARPAPEVSGREPLAPPPPEPWPEPVEARAMLDELQEFIRRFVIVDAHALVAIALWVVFTHCFEIAETSPRLAILSPVKRCGKTRLLDLLELLCPSAVGASNLSPSAIFRTIDAERCTLLIDEADTFTGDNDELRGLLNSGHTRLKAFVIRNVPVGTNEWMPKRFSTWAPIAIAAIRKLPETWIDRSIVVSMRRKLRSQSVERLTRRNAEARERAADLASKLARFAKDNLEALKLANPESPALDSDRAVDNWEHLLAIADLAGSDWGARARAAAVALSNQSSAADDSAGIALLSDVREIFERDCTDKIASKALAAKLVELEDRPWATWHKGGRALTQNGLAGLLDDFGIKSKTIRPGDGSTPKGYTLSDFRDAFSRYLPDPLVSKRHTATSVGEEEENGDFRTATDGARGGSKNGASPHGEKGCGVVADETPGIGTDRRNSSARERFKL